MPLGFRGIGAPDPSRRRGGPWPCSRAGARSHRALALARDAPDGSNGGTGNSGRAVQLGDAPTAADPVRHAGANEIRSVAADSGRASERSGGSPTSCHSPPPSARDRTDATGRPRRASLIAATFSPSSSIASRQPQPSRRQSFLCSRFTSIEQAGFHLSRPVPLGRPDPKPPILRLRFFRNRLKKSLGLVIAMTARTASAPVFGGKGVQHANSANPAILILPMRLKKARRRSAYQNVITYRTSTPPSVPMMLRQSPAGSLPLRAEVETSHGYASYH